MTEDLLSPAEAMAELGISRSHLGYLARKHNIGQKFGPRHRAYRPEDIERLRQIRRDNPPGHYDRTNYRKKG